MEKNSADSAVRKKKKDSGSVFAAGSSNGGRHIAQYLYGKRLGFPVRNPKDPVRSANGGKAADDHIAAAPAPHDSCSSIRRCTGAVRLPLQTFFHNPIAGPFVLGISSGAKMVVALVMVFFLGRGRMVNSAGMITAAFAGAMLSMGFVLLMSRRIRRMSMLVVSGVMIGYICSAVTELVVTFAQDADIVNLHNWSLGSFSGTTWSSVRAACICVTVIFVLVFLMSKPLSAYQLGESYALNLGVNVRLLRIGMVVFSSILSACVVAFAGPISFVGIAVPQLVKKCWEPQNRSG